MQNQSQLPGLKAQAKQAKNKLVEEKSRMSSYLEKIKELKLTTKIQDDCHHRAEEK